MNTIERYIWLVDTLRRSGKLTYDEIAAKWDRAYQNDERLPLAKRSFLNHIKAIETQMGISIVCDRRDGYRYRIEEETAQDGLKEWLMESVAVSNTVSESRDLAGRIMLEQIPSGHQHLSAIIEAMRSNTSISISHLSFWHHEPTMREVRPYGLRLVDRRWYLIGYVEEYEDVRIYGLDRILDIDFTERTFEYPEDFKLDEYFEGCYGVVRIGDIETIRIRVTDNEQKYIGSLPLHESQKLIERNDAENYAIFEYQIRPTIDFTMRILSYGSAVEVLEPQWYRDEIVWRVKDMLKTYRKTNSRKG